MSNTASIRGTWAIAVYTWREGMRKKTLIGFLLLSLLVILGSTFMTAFMTEASIGENIDASADTKIVKDICVSAISVFGILITIFISASVVPTEVENRVIYTILSKPIRRFQYLLGKFVGVQLIVIINLVLMTLLFFTALWVKESQIPTLLLWSALLTYFQFLIVSSFTFAISCLSSSAVMPTIGGLFIFITGNLTEYLKDVSNRASSGDGTIDLLLGTVAKRLYDILPNLQSFSLRTEILYLAPNDPPKDVMIPYLIVYGLAYGLAGYLLAFWLFRRREL
jgi:ABC-type transport system involved in multi-copper enzyme maturation permease subunit